MELLQHLVCLILLLILDAKCRMCIWMAPRSSQPRQFGVHFMVWKPCHNWWISTSPQAPAFLFGETFSWPMQCYPVGYRVGSGKSHFVFLVGGFLDSSIPGQYSVSGLPVHIEDRPRFTWLVNDVLRTLSGGRVTFSLFSYLFRQWQRLPCQTSGWFGFAVA